MMQPMFTKEESHKMTTPKTSWMKIYNSDINNELLVVYEDGKKILNTKNTNYSYGTLVDVLEYGLDTIPMENINSVLLLGMGVGSIIKSLREKYNCNAEVTAVEIDPTVIEIAKTEFDFDNFSKVKIENCDAWDFVENSKQKFDLIINRYIY
ncbi:MAG: spermidine synthase [Bacteroidales bacterium]